MMGKRLFTHQTGPKGKEVKDFILKKLQKLKKILSIVCS